MDAAVCPVDGCQIPIDVVLRSSDNVLIGAHKANLDSHTDGFPAAESTSSCDDAADLSEDSETLTLLMPFVHKEKYPDLFDLSEERLFALAHAAEKYVVHPAIGVCSVFIRSTWKNYPLSALAYALQHDYPVIADIASRATLSLDLSAVELKLDGVGLYAWLKYKTTYIERINKIFYRQGPRTKMWSEPSVIITCDAWDNYFPDIQRAVPQPSYEYFGGNTGASLLSLLNSRGSDCSSHVRGCGCESAVRAWKEDLVGLIDTVPAFTSYLSG